MTDKWSGGTNYLSGALVVPTTQPETLASPPTNADFESGVSGWTLGSGWAISNVGSSGSFAGSWVGVCTNATPSELLNANVAAAVPGQKISAFVRLNASANVGNAGHVFIEWQDNTNTRIGVAVGNVVSANGDWQLSTVDGVAPSGAAFARLGVSAVAVGGSVKADNATWSYITPATLSALMYQCTTAGTSGTTEPVWPALAGTVTDGTVVWTGVATNRVVWEAHALLVSGSTEPTWPTHAGDIVSDGTIQWTAQSRRITDPKCPNSKCVTMGESKMYAGNRDITPYCATVNPLDWSTANDAGYLPTGLHQNGSNDIAVLNIYRGNLAGFSASTFQMWQIDPDPAQIDQLDQMEGIGSTQQLACQPVGTDLYYLAQQGVRSIGISIASTNLQANDIGKPIDPLIQIAVAGCTNVPLGFYFPSAGQYWLAFNEIDGAGTCTVYVFTTGTPGAWSHYDYPFVIDNIVQLDGVLYLRSGDNVHAVTPDTVSDETAPGVFANFDGIVHWPWLDFGSPGVNKKTIGFDWVGTGSPSIAFGYDQTNLSAFTADYPIPADTVPGQVIPFQLLAPSLSVRVTFAGGQAWSFNQFLLYLQEMRATS